jgi:hypothetical protein
MWDDLQHRREHSPEWSKRYMKNPESKQPEKTNRDRVLRLRHGPAAKRRASESKMIADSHDWNAGFKVDLKKARHHRTLGNFHVTSFSWSRF